MPPGPFREASRALPWLYMFGAVCHDCLYYAVGSSVRRGFERTERELNGYDGGDTFQPVLRMLDPESISGRALAAGAWTHIALDASFHPMIYNLAGRRYGRDPHADAAASARHHDLETRLDLHLLQRGEPPGRGSFARVLKRVEIPGTELVTLLDTFYDPDTPHSGRAIRRMLLHDAILQGLLRLRVTRRLTRALNHVTSRDLSPIVTACYPSTQPRSDPLFRSAVHYLHPVTGEDKNETVDEIFRKAARQALAWIGRFGDPGKAAQPPCGPNLATGIPGTRYDEMVHFSDQCGTMEQ